MLGWLKKLSAGKEPAERVSDSKIKEWVNEGFTSLQAGDSAQAKQLFAAVLREQPENADALYLSAVLEQGAGRHEEAAALLARAIASDAGVASFHHTLGTVLFLLGREHEALASFRRAVDLDPEDIGAQTDLGCALGQAGKYEEAARHLQLALQREPNAVQTRYNLGTVLHSLNRIDDAIGQYRACLSLDPAHADAANNLSLLWQTQGKTMDAIACLQRIVALRPDHAPSWGNLGYLLQINRQPVEAETCLREAIRLDAGNFSFHSNLALVLREQSRLDESVQSSENALQISDSFSERIRVATLVPVVARDAGDIPRWRRHFEASLDRLLVSPGRIDDPLREISVCNFNLAFQPECNRVLQEKTAQLYLKAAPSLDYTAPHCLSAVKRSGGRIKVGFISKFFYNHIGIGRTTRGLMAHLDREQFELTALFVPPLKDDETSRFIREHSEHQVILPDSLEAARETIAELELDILFYQDIGMESFTYFLAFSRLAPVQCVSFGFPDTTGIPNMDYWISSDNFEPRGAEEHYSEQLYLLRNIGTLAYYYRPVITPPAKTRAFFGLSQESHLYICPQSLFKAHPDFDTVFANILRADPQGEIILVQGTIPAWEAILRERFRQTMPDVAERIRFVPRMDQDVFLELIAVSDVMLDPFYFSGMNSSLEGLAVGTPVVTMPGDLQRGRHTYGMYRHMEMDDCIADSPQHYAELALKLGTDEVFRTQIREKILARCPRLYEDPHVVREFERFFRESHEKAARARPAP